MVGEAVVDGADHVVVVGRVEAARGVSDTAPLVHLRRNGLKY
jgi:flavin reductase (DIM6/NTAB) family NADH-FMN oxidoreductase RutF